MVKIQNLDNTVRDVFLFIRSAATTLRDIGVDTDTNPVDNTKDNILTALDDLQSLVYIFEEQGVDEIEGVGNRLTVVNILARYSDKYKV